MSMSRKERRKKCKGEEGKKGAETKKVNSPIPAWATDVFIGYEEQ